MAFAAANAKGRREGHSDGKGTEQSDGKPGKEEGEKAVVAGSGNCKVFRTALEAAKKRALKKG